MARGSSDRFEQNSEPSSGIQKLVMPVTAWTAPGAAAFRRPRMSVSIAERKLLKLSRLELTHQLMLLFVQGAQLSQKLCHLRALFRR